MSDTPRTEEQVLRFKGDHEHSYVPADFARQLERELNAMRDEKFLQDLAQLAKQREPRP